MNWIASNLFQFLSPHIMQAVWMWCVFYMLCKWMCVLHAMQTYWTHNYVRTLFHERQSLLPPWSNICLSGHRKSRRQSAETDLHTKSNKYLSNKQCVSFPIKGELQHILCVVMWIIHKSIKWMHMCVTFNCVWIMCPNSPILSVVFGCFISTLLTWLIIQISPSLL